MSEEILDRLERIDHKEYCGGFEFADSATFEEMGRCFDERKQLANYTKKLQQENKQLKSILTELEEWLKEQGNNGIDEWGNHYSVCLYKLNKLKENYK